MVAEVDCVVKLLKKTSEFIGKNDILVAYYVTKIGIFKFLRYFVNTSGNSKMDCH